MSVLGNMEGEKRKVVFDDEDFSLSRLKRSFEYSLCSWASLVVVSVRLL